MTVYLRNLPRKKWKPQCGAALIVVLVCLILVSSLTIAFLVSMKSKLTLSKSGSDFSEVKMLAETAANIAISQVQDATRKAGQNSLAWASQPGMIRLYNNTGAAGYYKLYSADNLVSPSGAFTPASDAVPPDWASKPAIFTDLNDPANGIFPILDYTAATTLGVQGLSLGTVPGPRANQPVPMPVKWMYVLEDGSMYIAEPSSTGTRAVVTAATDENPIVGRVAFWTDDESCKVNVNTASEGTFWATPRFNTTGDRLLAEYQPARGEFQRYPGHPATVSLKSLFPNLTSQQIFSIAPRLTWGGSEGASKKVQDVAIWVTTDTDRLYASLDEMLFKIPTAAGRTVQDGLRRSDVAAARFFLTASSRVPELNLFGLPRIATWPIHAINDTNYRTVNDRLIAFCSTSGGPPPAATYPFYFTRQENLLPAHDISLPRNTELLDYLDRLTGMPIPGFGGKFQTKYTQPETRQILTEIFDYIRCTNLFDYTTPQNPVGFWPYAFGISSRGGKGTNDPGEGVSLGTAAPTYRDDWGTQGFGGRFLQVRAAHLHFVGLGDASTPIDPLQAGVRVGAAAVTPLPPNTIAVQAYLYLSTLTPSEGIEYWSPGHWIEIEGLDKFGVKLNPADQDYSDLQFPQKAEMTIMGNMMGGGGVVGGRVAGLEPYGFITAKDKGKILTLDYPADHRRVFSFFSAIMPVSSTSPTMAFRGGTITIRIYAEQAWQVKSGPPIPSHGKLVKEFSLTFPDASFPTPLLGTNRRVGSGDLTLPTERLVAANSGKPSPLFEPTHDVLKSVPLVDGDIRLLAGPNASTSFYSAQPDYFDNTKRMVPETNSGSIVRNGKLIANATYSNQNPPFVPDHINGAFTDQGAPGDWDNGTSVTGDGPFINAADPGNIAPGTSTTPGYYYNSITTASKNGTFFSPNRQMPGPGMFGSLSTGVQRRQPWQTLLFRPGPANHEGAGTPPDHLMLDLFWMPIVEPYALSEPFSTAGKINMNQQLVPFTYINRTAGVRAALGSEQVAMVKKSDATDYKNTSSVLNLASRKALNLSETNGTLRQFKEKFDTGEIFRSATEICDIYLVPDGQTWSSNAAAQTAWYGDAFALVGDNTRERPYTHLYNKLSTKSNTFTVHYQVQILQKPKARTKSDPTVFDTSQGDMIAAEQRGSTTFERYLDPADPRIVAKDPASPSATSLEEFYRTRIVNTTVFNP